MMELGYRAVLGKYFSLKFWDRPRPLSLLLSRALNSFDHFLVNELTVSRPKRVKMKFNFEFDF